MEVKRDGLEVPTQDQGLSDYLGAGVVKPDPNTFLQLSVMLSCYHDIMTS
jgi:hypothetical protein